MDVHVGSLRATVEMGTAASAADAARASDEVVREVLDRLERRRQADTDRRADTRLWDSALGQRQEEQR